MKKKKSDESGISINKNLSSFGVKASMHSVSNEGMANKMQDSLDKKAAAGFDKTASDVSFQQSGDINRVPLLYMDPLFDPILMLFPKDNVRELNRRLRHYYQYNPYIRNIIDLHSCKSNVPINCKDGVKEIKDFIGGEEVLCNDGKFHKVLWQQKHPFNGEMYKIKPHYLPAIDVTFNHPVGVYDKDNKSFAWKFAKDINLNSYIVVPKFKPNIVNNQKLDLADYINLRKTFDTTHGEHEQSGRFHDDVKTYKGGQKTYTDNVARCYEIKNDVIVIRKSKKVLPRFIDVTPELCELLGWYVAEGSCNSQSVTAFCLHKDEKEHISRIKFLLKSILGVDAVERGTHGNAWQIYITNTLLKNMFQKECGAGSHNKQAPEWLYNSSNECAKSFLKAYLNGDGCLHSDRSYISCITVSKKLSYQLLNIASKCGAFFGISNRHPKYYKTREYVLVMNKKEAFTKLLDKKEELNNDNKDRFHLLEDANNFYVKIHKIEKYEYSGDVYDIKTEAHSFCTPILIHNSEFPLSDFDFKCVDPSIEKYFNDFADRKELLQTLIMGAKDYWLLGEGMLYGNWNEYDKEFESFNQYPPEDIEVKPTYMSSYVYMMKPNENIVKQLKSRDPVDQKINDMMEQENPQFVKCMRSGQPYPFDDKRFMHLARRPNKYTPRGISPVLSCIKDLLYEDQVRLLLTTFVNRHTAPIKIFKIGSKEKGWIPPASKYREFEQQLIQASNDPDFNIVTHPFVEVDYVTGRDKIMDVLPHFDFTAKRYMVGLFVNDAVLHGEMGTYASSAISIKVLMNKYMAFREMVASMITEKILYPICVKRGFKLPKKADIDHRVRTERSGYDVPKIMWRRSNLINNREIMDYAVRLRDNGEIPFKYIAELFDWDLEAINKQFEKEEGTHTDKLWRSIREKKSEETQIANQILDGKKTKDLEIFPDKKDKDTPPEEGGITTDTNEPSALSEMKNDILGPGSSGGVPSEPLPAATPSEGAPATTGVEGLGEATSGGGELGGASPKPIGESEPPAI